MIRMPSRRTVLGAGAVAAGALLMGVGAQAAESKRRVVVWSEGTAPKKVYPNDINSAVAEGLRQDLQGWEVVVANLKDADQGLDDDRLNGTDVLIWWGHQKHGDVQNPLVRKIVQRVKEGGMGFIALHSAHFAKPNRALMGKPCSWGAYVNDSTTLSVKVKMPDHPIARGVEDFVIDHFERYDNPYAVPKADVVFDGEYTLKDGRKTPSQLGFCWKIGNGNMFYFQPGHETNGIFFDPRIRRIMSNAVRWAAPAQA